jgi:hypothetical protein
MSAKGRESRNSTQSTQSRRRTRAPTRAMHACNLSYVPPVACLAWAFRQKANSEPDQEPAPPHIEWSLRTPACRQGPLSYRLCIAFSKLRQNGSHLLHLDRLCQEQIHTTCKRLFLCGRVAQTRDSHNHGSRASTRTFEASYRSGSLEAIHHGHINIH